MQRMAPTDKTPATHARNVATPFSCVLQMFAFYLHAPETVYDELLKVVQLGTEGPR